MEETQINELAEKISAKIMVATKRVLSIDEVCQFTGMKKGHIYKLTSSHSIPFYKPNNKLVYFDREEIERWMLTNRTATTAEVEEMANSYIEKGGAK